MENIELSTGATTFAPARANAPAPIADGRYEVRVARGRREIEAALRLRYEVFSVELNAPGGSADGLESDAFDDVCDHLVVIETMTGRTVGTYRLNTIEKAGGIAGFYSFGEFAIERLPPDVLRRGIEIGRACVAPEHRNTRVLFLLWRGLAQYMREAGKNYFFGCCSIFSRDPADGAAAFRKLAADGHVHETIRVEPRVAEPLPEPDAAAVVELPALFNMYLRVGARVCSLPIVDRDFGTIDFFVVFDLRALGPRHRRMFF